MLVENTEKKEIENKAGGGKENMDADPTNAMDQSQKKENNGKRTKKVRNCECVYLTRRCVLFRNLMTDTEINQIYQLSARSLVEGWGSQQLRNFGKTGSKQANYSAVKTGGHTVTFLEEKFAKKLPHIFSFMNKVLQKIDHQTGWNILKSAKVVSPRRMEFLQYASRHKTIFKEHSDRPKTRDDGLGWHFDTDSLLNLIVMCSHQNEYEGGLLQLKVKLKKGGVRILTVPEFERGDAVVFLSDSTEHRVTPTTGGLRCTFVYELWDQDGYDEGTDTSSGCESHSSESSSSSTEIPQHHLSH